MNKLSKSAIRDMIVQEIAKMVGEDALVSGDKDMYRNTGLNPNARTPHNISTVKQSDSYADFGGASTSSSCSICGCTDFNEGSCMECGYVKEEVLQEAGCGCGSVSLPAGNDYSIETMGMGMLSNVMNDMNVFDKANHEKGHNDYMAKPSLYKVAKYAQKLLQMIPDGYELDDWQRTKIAQISDDISEVYHSLDYDFYNDEF